MDALTMADLKRMQKAGLLTLEEFLKETAKLIKQAGDRAADDDDDVQIVGHRRVHIYPPSHECSVKCPRSQSPL